MKQFYIRNIIITAITIFFSTSTFAQNNTLYWMRHLPQTMNTNPAKQSNCKFFIDIPVLPNFSFDVTHTGFSFDDAIMNHPTKDTTYMIDFITIEKALGEKRNSIDFETEISLINFGLAIKNNMYVTFGVNYKLSENFQYPKALIEITHGNYRPNGETLSFDFKESFMFHREFYLGLSKSFYDKLYIGGRVKFLNGYANLNTKQMNLNWRTSTIDDEIYDWTFVADVETNASVPVAWELQKDSLGKVSDVEIEVPEINENNIYGSIKDVIPHNFGMGVDLGVEYKINKNILVSASIVDLGFIKWKTNPINVNIDNTSFSFKGIDVANYLENLNDSAGSIDGTVVMKDIIDSVTTSFNPTITSEAYTTGLNTKIYAGTNFTVNDWLDFGLLYKGLAMNKNLYSSFTASANLNFLRGWSYTLTYSIIDRLANNIGMGLAYKLGPFQMYFISDNIAAPFWALNQSNFSDKWIRNTQKFNFAFGMNFMICKKKHDVGLLE